MSDDDECNSSHSPTHCLFTPQHVELVFWPEEGVIQSQWKAWYSLFTRSYTFSLLYHTRVDLSLPLLIQESPSDTRVSSESQRPSLPQRITTLSNDLFTRKMGLTTTNSLPRYLPGFTQATMTPTQVSPHSKQAPVNPPGPQSLRGTQRHSHSRPTQSGFGVWRREEFRAVTED